jgi:cytochrome c oxidase cbb3-type subunit 3
MSGRERDEITNTETTGHEWDGIKELNTPLPRWWLWTFYITIAWSLAYTVAYPAWPMLTSATSGVLGYSSRAAVAEDVAMAKAEQKQYLDKIASSSLEEIRTNPELLQFAQAGGRAAFRVNCVQCHGSGAAGGNGYPNLNDDDWLWGGTMDQIHATLVNGIRYPGNEETRQSQMPAFGADGILTSAEISDTAEYVLKISGKDHDSAAADRGATLFTDNCASCHGDNGVGNHEFGAPRLDDAISLYASDREGIIAQINRPRQGVMPAWSGRLDEITIKQLAVFVHSLGGGTSAAP